MTKTKLFNMILFVSVFVALTKVGVTDENDPLIVNKPALLHSMYCRDADTAISLFEKLKSGVDLRHDRSMEPACVRTATVVVVRKVYAIAVTNTGVWTLAYVEIPRFGRVAYIVTNRVIYTSDAEEI